MEEERSVSVISINHASTRSAEKMYIYVFLYDRRQIFFRAVRAFLKF